MEDINKEKLQDAGAKLKPALERFMNDENLYVRFLKKFLNDENYDKLSLSLEENNYEDAFNCAHNLKGVSLNLGLDSLSIACDDMAKRFREKDYTQKDLLFEKITDKYNKYINIIKEL